MKGRAPARIYEVRRPRARRARLDAAIERGLTPLIDRERELATLLDRFGEVKGGRGQVVGLAGEAGIGKSRLLLEFRRALAAGRGHRDLAGGALHLLWPVHPLPAPH